MRMRSWKRSPAPYNASHFRRYLVRGCVWLQICLSCTAVCSGPVETRLLVHVVHVCRVGVRSLKGDAMGLLDGEDR